MNGVKVGADEMSVGSVMAAAVVTGKPADSVVYAARMMVELGIHHLVITEDDKPVGVVSSLDLVGSFHDMVVREQMPLLIKHTRRPCPF